MRQLRYHRDFLAWLMSVAVTCNIILAMVCCSPMAASHANASGDIFASVLCTTGGLKSATPDGSQPAGHKSLHSDCLLCSHAPGGSHVPLAVAALVVIASLRDQGPAAFARQAPLAASYFAFAEPSSRGPPRI